MKMNELTANEIGMQELTMNEIDEVSGGVLCLIVIAAVAGYGVGTMIYKTFMK
jgi:hypothetical protein